MPSIAEDVAAVRRSAALRSVAFCSQTLVRSKEFFMAELSPNTHGAQVHPRYVMRTEAK
jgi:hypothetical protein